MKPAIKENFFYATGAKAWRAETPAQLLHLYRKAAKQIRAEEMVLPQEIIPATASDNTPIALSSGTVKHRAP